MEFLLQVKQYLCLERKYFSVHFFAVSSHNLILIPLGEFTINTNYLAIGKLSMCK